MKINVTDQAMVFFEAEFDTERTPNIRLFAKYGGDSNIHHGFSVGITAELPEDPIVTVKVGDLNFYVEETDYWYFDGYDWNIDYDKKTDLLDFDSIVS